MVLLNNLCRTCNTEKRTLENIFDQKEKQSLPALTYMLEYCTQTTVKDSSEYPRGICYNCTKQLEICYRFLKRFRLAQREFDEAHNIVQVTMKEIKSSIAAESEEMPCFGTSEQMQTSLSLPENKLPETTASVKHDEPILELSSEYIQPAVNTGLPKTHYTSNVSIARLRPKLGLSSEAFVCRICHKPFFTNKALTLHFKINHKQKYV